VSKPSSYRTRLALAKYYSAPESFNAAMAFSAAQELLKLDAGRMDAYTILAQVYAEEGDWNALDSTLTESARQCPDDLVPYYRAAETLFAKGREPERVARYLRIYLESEP
jgi:hypothetical protein